MALINYTKYNKKENRIKYKKQLNKLKNEVGTAGSKSTQTRDNRIYYISLRLLFEGYKNITSNNAIESKLINSNHYDN